MKRIKKLWLGAGCILLLALLTINFILIYKEDSKIARSYYIKDYERVALEHQKAYLEKEALIIPREEIRITADAKALSHISVRAGQKISSNEEIAAYKTDEATLEQSNLQSEVNAYENELTTLERILRRIEAQNIDDPITTIDSEIIDDELSITIETQMTQGSPIEAIATIEKQIAEIERTIEILEDRIANLSFSNVLSSPIDGVIGDVIDENGTITFIIYTDEKNLITYVSEKEWEKVEENQSVELDSSIFENDLVDSVSLPNTEEETVTSTEEEQQEVTGFIIEKQSIPALKTLWYKEMEKVVTMPEPRSFEVRIDLNNSIGNKPYASLTRAKIIVNESPNAFRVDKDWLITKKIAVDTETKKISQIHSIGADGKIQMTEVDIGFEDKGDAIVTSGLPNDLIIFKNKVKNDGSEAFFPMPFETPSKAILKNLDWEQYAKYIFF